jgi:signal transduction histidine kinase
MRSRVESLHGHFRVSPGNPRGTLIEARLPRADRDAGQ